MSFDLDVFSYQEATNSSDIRAAYSDANIEWSSSLRFEEFCETLFRNHPPLNECSSDQIDDSPWAHTYLKCGHLKLGFVSGDKAGKVLDYVLNIAKGFGMFVYDPQGDQVYFRGKELKE